MPKTILILTKNQYLSAIEVVDSFWLNEEETKKYLINRIGGSKNEQEWSKCFTLSKVICFMNKRYGIGTIRREDYSYWLEIFEQLRKIKEPLETGKICCWWRKTIYDFLESSDSRFMNEKNKFSTHFWVMTPLIKLKLAGAAEYPCSYCKLLMKILDESVSKWNKEKRFCLPYDERFE